MFFDYVLEEPDQKGQVVYTVWSAKYGTGIQIFVLCTFFFGSGSGCGFFGRSGLRKKSPIRIRNTVLIQTCKRESFPII